MSPGAPTEEFPLCEVALWTQFWPQTASGLRLQSSIQSNSYDLSGAIFAGEWRERIPRAVGKHPTTLPMVVGVCPGVLKMAQGCDLPTLKWFQPYRRCWRLVGYEKLTVIREECIEPGGQV